MVSVTMIKSDIHHNYSGTLYTDLIVGQFIHINMLLIRFLAVGKQVL